jgi:hypothetical protein
MLRSRYLLLDHRHQADTRRDRGHFVLQPYGDPRYRAGQFRPHVEPGVSRSASGLSPTALSSCTCGVRPGVQRGSDKRTVWRLYARTFLKRTPERGHTQHIAVL